MLCPNKFHDPASHQANREKFAGEMEYRANKQRNGMFTQALPLTVGDTSNNYQTYRKERDECGRTKSVQVNQCRSAKESFTRFISNSSGDPFQEPGTFNKTLRDTSPVLRAASTSHISPFTTQGNRTVRKAEFSYNDNTKEPKGSYALRPFADRPGGFFNRKTAEPFTN